VYINKKSVWEKRKCDRVVIDEWADSETIDALISIAQTGMTAAEAFPSQGGPVIMDANSGYVMKPGSLLSNMYWNYTVKLFDVSSFKLRHHYISHSILLRLLLSLVFLDLIQLGNLARHTTNIIILILMLRILHTMNILVFFICQTTALISKVVSFTF